jgi:hypothetical protein
MGLFGKSDEERHIEAIKQEVVAVNSLLKSLMVAIENGEYYCRAHKNEIWNSLNGVAAHFNTIKGHARYVPEQKLAMVQVAWGDGVSTNNFMMWGMLTETGMNEVAECLTKWGM